MIKNAVLSLILLNPDQESKEIKHQSCIGTLICKDGHAGRCVGKKINLPKIHECCSNAEFWELQVEMSEIEIWGPLLRMGGDAISLSLNDRDTLLESKSDQILKSFEFKTSKLMIDNEAKQFISKYYPDLSFTSDMVACLGIASWEYNL
jgi:hypothetical protein